MARCPKCGQSFAPSVVACPHDGWLLGGAAPNLDGETAAIEVGTVAPTPGVAPAAAFAAAATALPAPAAEPAPAAGEALNPGDMVGEYRVTGKLGEGGMGSVYSGEHPVIGKRVAIKVLAAALSQDAAVVQRFVQEARSVNQIGHKNIIDIFSFGELPSKRQYFIMEFLPGRSLKDRLEQQPPLSYVESFAILSDVASALAAAHSEGIVHRDLKPENIYLATSKGGEVVVKLLDFGIAKLTTGDGVMSQTRTGTVMGTPYFMSPEQCVGKQVDHRTDIYAFGVMMFQLFTGQLPFPGSSYAEIVSLHLTQAPPSPTDYADLPPELSDLILACMEKDAALRPQTMNEVRERLRPIAQQLGADSAGRSVAPQTPGSPQLAPLRRTPPPRVSGSFGAATRPPAAPVAAPPKRLRLGLVLGAAGVGVAGVAVVAVLALKSPPPPPPPAPVAAAPASTIELQVVSEPVAAQVSIDGVVQELRTPSVFKLPRKAEVTVAVTKDGFKSNEQRVAFPDGATQRSITVSLEALKAPGGRVEISTKAKKAVWTLDGKEVGDGTGSLKLADVAPGEHKLAVTPKGYEAHEETVVVTSKELTSAEWKLRRSSHEKGSSAGAVSDDDNATAGFPAR